MRISVRIRDRSSFTLIELLVVIGVLGTLATAVILVINPAELLKQARDSTRLSDLASLNQVLSLFQVDQYNLSMGTSSTVYVSVPDTSPTCANLGLPALPGGWSYSCVSTSTLTKVNGTGWIPLNLTLLSTNSPLSRLPIDPINTTSTGNYYTYTSGGSWELATLMESSKQKMGGGSDKASTDGGSYPELYEMGTDLSLLPVSRDPSLVGYWKFDEGSGTNAYDASGHGNDGTMYSAATPTDFHTSTGCKIGSCGNFNGVNEYVGLPSYSSYIMGKSQLTYSSWFKVTGLNGTYEEIIEYGTSDFALELTLNAYTLRSIINNGSTLTSAINPNVWYHGVIVYDAPNLRLYVNGALVSSVSNGPSSVTNSRSAMAIGARSGGSLPFVGLIDNVRIYNRALSAAEVQAIYTAGQ